MNVFDLHGRLIEDYRLYVESFIQIKDERIIQSIFGNVGALLAFRLGREDSQLIEPQFLPYFDRMDLANLPNWQVAARLTVRGRGLPPFTIQTSLPEEKPNSAIAKEVRRLSREKYGKPRAEVVQGEIQWGDVTRSLDGTELYMPLGATLVFTTYIENIGEVPLRTSGPPSGTPYRSDQNSNTLAVELDQPSYHEQAGVWRFGINFDVSG